MEFHFHFHFLIFALGVAVAAASGYQKPAYNHGYKAEPHHEEYPAPKYDEIPACSKNTTKPWCLEDSEYPKYDVEYALDYHYDAVLGLYKDQVVNTENSVDTLKSVEEETYLCPSATAYVLPLRAINTEGKWRVIVNKVEARYYKFDQNVRVEECTAEGENCPLVPPCYGSRCLQKNIYHRFLVYDPYDQYFPFAIESFKLPASCSCLLEAFLH
ncbi:neurotrophin 1-like [Artemia franciscana]|uniref:Spaetzle domain-containing protein n=2 Tax=Artemia franciscana TaxID=6661 RepID=A0AA88IC21_ARTSF|nr:hypothetical protein QYM36_000789 [Artemia franciscana]